jgi:hypothetical protein
VPREARLRGGRGLSGLGCQCDNEVGREGGCEAFEDADGGHDSSRLVEASHSPENLQAVRWPLNASWPTSDLSWVSPGDKAVGKRGESDLELFVTRDLWKVVHHVMGLGVLLDR